MERNLDEIASAALQLNLKSRAELAKLLLDSLDDVAPEEAMHLQVEEAIRRNRQIDEGTAETFAWEDVLAELEARPRR
jgi:hypothetical protein